MYGARGDGGTGDVEECRFARGFAGKIVCRGGFAPLVG